MLKPDVFAMVVIRRREKTPILAKLRQKVYPYAADYLLHCPTRARELTRTKTLNCTVQARLETAELTLSDAVFERRHSAACQGSQQRPKVSSNARLWVVFHGPAKYNIGLSVRSAEAVKKFLVQEGIPANKVVTEGVGEAQPVASNNTRDGRALNRRVEVEFVGSLIAK